MGLFWSPVSEGYAGWEAAGVKFCGKNLFPGQVAVEDHDPAAACAGVGDFCADLLEAA
ncbi:MAG: hypothetical protein QXZ08_00750 [Nitrososphaeria archaeon]